MAHILERTNKAPSQIARCLRLARSPLILNGYSLVLSAGTTSVLGMVYWVLAARLYTVEQVGLNATMISSAATISSIAQLNLASVLNRFLPTSGRFARRWILWSYAAATSAALLVGLTFILGARVWAPSMQFLTADSWAAAAFIVASMPWTVFALQDGVLAGLRKAVLVPVGSTLFALAKIALLVALASGAYSAFGPFIAWTVSLIGAVCLVNWLIFRHVLTKGGATHVKVDMRLLLRYVGGDFIGTLLFMATIGLIPIIVLERSGAGSTAEYYLAWTIAYSLYLVSKQMGVSLVVEGAVDRRQLRALAVKTLTHTMSLLAIAVLIVVAGAPLILRMFGPAYESASLCLRLLALSALPFGFTSMFLSVARVQGRMVAVAAAQGAMMVLVLGIGVPLLKSYGSAAMAIGWLAAQTIIALLLGVICLGSSRWLLQPEKEPTQPQATVS